jgi:hypothetical protein
LFLFTLLQPAVKGNLLLNPSMTEGEDTPIAWTDRWVGSGSLVGARDVDAFRSAPASLRVAVSGSGKGQIGQSVPVSAGQRYQIGAWLKSGDGVRAQIGITYKDRQDQPIDYEQIRYNAGPEDWTHSRRIVRIPSLAVTATIVLMVEGDGSAWMDDVTLETAASVSNAPHPAAVQPVVLRDFALSGFDYGYEGWEDLQQLAQRTSTGVMLRGSSRGGAGFVLEHPITRRGATHLQLTLVVGYANTMTQLKLVTPEPSRLEFPIELGLYPQGQIRDVRIPLPANAPEEFKHFQIQGSFAAGETLDIELRSLSLIGL